ncbi:PHP domain-containing protein [Geitlerinema calcuttense]|uniref:PHP domain-containing protein n=1 Tax=Geitlerinema calcuttense NRMC-F 0142 TaxID=2922238 RepID=A0ABT7LZF2_9CYAN|nr:PHP domain-containing protein [Geitlerinema calcuttense]MDL5056942.1 PHP domain-containing protein [Geitlerinema calcuttense NRMC-F 0142]
MKLKFDLHCHSRFSADGVAEPEDMVRVAKERGLNGFAITDHNTCECVEYFLRHGMMREDGMPVDDFLIIPGQEVTTAQGHLLGLGVVLPDLRMSPATEVAKLIRRKGGIAIPPHPYDLFRAGIRESDLDAMEFDALEVFNAATTMKRYNRQAFEYAKEKGYPMTSSSDAHHAEALGTAYTILEVKEFSVRGVLEAIKNGGELRQEYLTLKDSFKKTFNNVFRIKRGKKRKS